MAAPTRYGCFFCERSFSRRKMLDDHLREHHGRVPVWDQAFPGAPAAPSLRSSRSNRHLQQESGPQGRMRGGVVDHDPMEGLPVRRWEMMDVTIKQDAKEEGKGEGGKEGVNPNWPWPDHPLPKDFHLLPAHSQELLRRARAPNKNPNIAVFNRETGEYERPNLNPHNPAAMTPVNKVPNFKDSTVVTASTTTSGPKAAKNDAATEQEDDQDTEKPAPEEPHERTITLKRWAPLPQSIADKKPEPKYLADRRPGLPPLYGHQAAVNTSSSATAGYAPNISSTLTNTGDVVVGSVNVPTDRVANASGYRVTADGATVPIGPGIAGVTPDFGGQGQPEAKRRPPPPPPKRRKKGGGARSRRRARIASQAAGGGAGNAHSTAIMDAKRGGPVGEDGAAQVISAESRIQGEGKAGAERDVLMAEAADDAASSGSDDEESSEEGEVDELEVSNENENAPPEPEPAPTPAPTPAPAPAPAAATPATTPATAIAATSTAATTTATTATENLGTGTDTDVTPDVSIQPPSPDLLGNLESEIQGMEEGAPVT